jgi:RNA polymerase sigma-70 factor, ECF subfamily
MDKNIERTGVKKDLNERDLVERCRSGDPSGYEEFYKTYSGGVYTLAWKVLNDPEGAKDATQEIFMKAFRGLKNFQYQSKISTWLYRITVNHCRDMQRSQSRKKEVSAEIFNDENETESLLDRMPDGKPTASQEQQDKQIRQRVIEAINHLPIEFRETVYLKEIEDMSYEEIAKIVGCRLGTVKSRIFRAREQLQKELKDFYNEIVKGEGL